MLGFVLEGYVSFATISAYGLPVYGGLRVWGCISGSHTT